MELTQVPRVLGLSTSKFKLSNFAVMAGPEVTRADRLDYLATASQPSPGLVGWPASRAGQPAVFKLSNSQTFKLSNFETMLT